MPVMLKPPVTRTVRWMNVQRTHLRITLTGADGKEVSHVYRLERTDDGYLLFRDEEQGNRATRYRIMCLNHHTWYCNCPDSVKRPGKCKHVEGLRAALKALPF